MVCFMELGSGSEDRSPGLQFHHRNYQTVISDICDYCQEYLFDQVNLIYVI